MNVVVSAGPSRRDRAGRDVPDATRAPKAELEGLGLDVAARRSRACPTRSARTRVNVAQQDTPPGTAVPPGTVIVLHQGAAVAVTVAVALTVAVSLWFATEGFTEDQREMLVAVTSRTSTGPVFALVNLPEVVKGALFARYSRTTKSLRRLFLDEFAEDVDEGGEMTSVGVERAEKLYDRVFVEYGDDSVAQLGGVHLACEQASQPLAKALNGADSPPTSSSRRGTCATTTMPGGRWRATVPPELEDTGLEHAVPRVPRRGVRPLRRDVRADVRVVRAAVPAGRERLGLRLSLDDHREDVRHAAGVPAGRRPAPTSASTRPRSPTSSC